MVEKVQIKDALVVRVDILRIRFTMERNVEYVLAGLIEPVNAPFLYRKATLIACVGEGGDAGGGQKGGDGGGVNVAGENGRGSTGGSGGDYSKQELLPSNGIFGIDIL
jgi:hypothetical protein